MDIKEAAKAVHQEVIKWRRDLHRIPEIGFDLAQTSSYVQTHLAEMNIPYTSAAETGVIGLIKGGSHGPTLALRADMDALPINEETGLPFASENDNERVRSGCSSCRRPLPVVAALTALMADHGNFVGRFPGVKIA